METNSGSGLGTFFKVIIGWTWGRVARWWSRHVIKLRGVWSTEMREPNESGDIEVLHERVRLHQVGGVVWGELAAKSDDRRFLIRGEIQQDTFTGRFEANDSRDDSTLGRGVFMLKITSDRNKLIGHSAWHDADTNKIEESNYIWERCDP